MLVQTRMGKRENIRQGPLSAWLVKHEIVHRSLGFDYQEIENLQTTPEKSSVS